MREIKRSIARHLMEMHGVTQINKKQYSKPAKRLNLFQKNDGRKVSFFALHWRDYLDPASSYRKSLEAQLKRKAALQTRRYGKHVKASWPVPR